MFLLNIFSACIVAQINYFNFSGRIIDANDSSAIVGCNIVIRNSPLGAATNVQGRFVINNIPEGKHIIGILYVGFPPITDTILFRGDKPSIEKNYKIGFKVIKPIQISKIREYYDSLKLSAGGKTFISIIMDSLSLDNLSIVVYSTFINNTNCPVYIASPYKHRPAVTLQINKMNGNEIGLIKYIDYDYSQYDVIVLPPKGHFKYTSKKEPLPFNVINSSDSTFTIGIKYKAEPENVHIPYIDNITIQDYIALIPKYESNLQWCLPGEYNSENSLQFKCPKEKK
jgi:hypothetical protein